MFFCFLLQFDDQGLVNTDARTIAVPDSYVNIIPTDVRGITFSRTPQMNINILTLGNPDGVGAFFPKGLIGAISKPTGFNVTAAGTDDFPTAPWLLSRSVCLHCLLCSCSCGRGCVLCLCWWQLQLWILCFC